jgi:hypothetical protein
MEGHRVSWLAMVDWIMSDWTDNICVVAYLSIVSVIEKQALKMETKTHII